MVLNVQYKDEAKMVASANILINGRVAGIIGCFTVFRNTLYLVFLRSWVARPGQR